MMADYPLLGLHSFNLWIRVSIGTVVVQNFNHAYLFDIIVFLECNVGGLIYKHLFQIHFPFFSFSYNFCLLRPYLSFKHFNFRFSHHIVGLLVPNLPSLFLYHFLGIFQLLSTLLLLTPILQFVDWQGFVFVLRLLILNLDWGGMLLVIFFIISKEIFRARVSF